jgi:hypothetical protein
MKMMATKGEYHTPSLSRRNLLALFMEIGMTNFRRMYRMNECSFYALFDLLQPNLPQPPKKELHRMESSLWKQGLLWLEDGVQEAANMTLPLPMVSIRMRFTIASGWWLMQCMPPENWTSSFPHVIGNKSSWPLNLKPSQLVTFGIVLEL